MRIVYKLIAGFLTVAILTAAVAYIGLTATNAITDSYMEVKEETLPVMDSLEKMKFLSSDLIHLYTHGALSEHEDDESLEELKKTSEEYYSTLNKYEELVNKYSTDESNSLEKLKNATERFNRSGMDLMELGMSGAPIKGSKEYEEINEAHKELNDAIDEALEDEYMEFNEGSEQIEHTIESTRYSILFTSLITFILSIVIGSVISLSISNPMIRLTDAARKISSGDLDTSVDIRSNDETGVLADAFNKMVRNLSHEIEERKRSQEAIGESEEKFRTLFDNATDGIMLADLETKKQYMANKKICKMLGYGLEEILNLSAMDLHPEKDMPWIMEMFEKQARGEISLIENIPVKRKDGKIFYADINTSPVNIGGTSYNLGIFRDITERRRNEDMRRDNERLAIANRAKSEFLTVMSHELRTPLNAIIGFSELLKKKDAGDMNEKQQRYNENVLTSGKLLLRIIDDILDLSKVESGKMDLLIEHVPVAEAVNEVLETIKENARKQKVIVKIDLKPEIEFIDTDSQKFKQVLNNLLSNAVKFSKHEGGTVTLTAKKEGDMAKFSVSDTGIGIKEEDMGRLFHSFEQIDSGIARKYGGTGLGLAVSKKLVELLGGTITAQSKYGEGSTFAFTLPITAKKQGKT